MATLHKIATYLMMAMGVIHISLTPVFFKKFTVVTMWFVAQGVMGIFLSFLNFAARRLDWKEKVITRFCLVANALAAVFIGLYLLVDHEPPSFIVVALILCLLITSSLLARNSSKEFL